MRKSSSTSSDTSGDTQRFHSTSSGAAIDDRRRRPRLDSSAAGFLLREDDIDGEGEPVEVQVYDLSRLGVGFTCEEEMQIGSVCRIRIGYGPMRLARRMRVQRCERRDDAYHVGAEFA